MEARPGDFMPPSMLASEFAPLEPLEAGEAGTVPDIRLPIPALVEQALPISTAADRSRWHAHDAAPVGGSPVANGGGGDGSVDDPASLEETLDIAGRPQLMRPIRASLTELAGGETEVLTKDEILRTFTA